MDFSKTLFRDLKNEFLQQRAELLNDYLGMGYINNANRINLPSPHLLWRLFFLSLSPNPILMYNGGGYGSQSAICVSTIFHISAVHQ